MSRPKGFHHSPETIAKMREANRGAKGPAWKGGRCIDAWGYRHIKKPDHPSANCEGYVMEHRLVIEVALGRLLRAEETVHHVSGDKTDNRVENLVLFANRGAHVAHHHRLRRQQAHAGAA